LAVGVLPRKHKSRPSRKAVVARSVVAGVIVAAMVAAFLVVFALGRADRRNALKRPPRRLVEHASNGYPSKLLSDANASVAAASPTSPSSATSAHSAVPPRLPSLPPDCSPAHLCKVMAAQLHPLLAMDIFDLAASLHPAMRSPFSTVLFFPSLSPARTVARYS
ncbi:hypothetical protein Taro_048881, partial [Colocasia esculenta]|nr:hypothetical protein [Colocasia esculenta]